MTPSFILFLALFTLALYVYALADVYGPRVAERIRRRVKEVRVEWQQADPRDRKVMTWLGRALWVWVLIAVAV
jgi:type II secretory pathway component PulM